MCCIRNQSKITYYYSVKIVCSVSKQKTFFLFAILTKELGMSQTKITNGISESIAASSIP